MLVNVSGLSVLLTDKMGPHHYAAGVRFKINLARIAAIEKKLIPLILWESRIVNESCNSSCVY